MRRLFLLLCLAVLHGNTFACLWDRDTLGYEARQFPDVVQVVTGRFEHNPPLYYAMRLKRVAADRLGDGDEALAWMAKKRMRLEAIPGSLTSRKDHWYRYYANVGTFLVHRWVRAGADRGNLSEVRQAWGEIAQAIRINPQAHFGREKYQRLVLEWLLDPSLLQWVRDARSDSVMHRKAAVPFALYLREKHEYKADAVKGLMGLIVLGNGRENPDLMHALSTLPTLRRKANLGYLASLRTAELRREGKRSLIEPLLTSPQKEVLGEAHSGMLIGGEEVARVYPRLRREAEAWNQRRQEFMLARLRQGRHPDTDLTFWDGYHESPPPSLLMSGVWQSLLDPWKLLFYAFILSVTGIVVSTMRKWILWFKARHSDREQGAMLPRSMR